VGEVTYWVQMRWRDSGRVEVWTFHEPLQREVLVILLAPVADYLDEGETPTTGRTVQ
jgi:uncharacterized phage protein gp47/JayE